MNKGLELIEACWLFDVGAEKIEVVIHPQSIVHSAVQYSDGSVLAQMGNPDMRTPIAHALAWPKRIDAGVAYLDLFEIGQLNFEKPDLKAFPCLQLAYDAAATGGSAPTFLNAANEVAVQAYLDERIAFGQISQIVDETLARLSFTEPESLDAVQGFDSEARSFSSAYITEIES